MMSETVNRGCAMLEEHCWLSSLKIWKDNRQDDGHDGIITLMFKSSSTTHQITG